MKTILKKSSESAQPITSFQVFELSVKKQESLKGGGDGISIEDIVII